MNAQQGTRLLDRLLGEKRISPDQYEATLLHSQRTAARIEDALVDTGAMSEADLLKYLATVYRTRFVATDKLAKADIDRTTLELIPRKTAEKLCVFPVVFDEQAGVLSVVAGDLEELDLDKQVALAASVREVKLYVARPAAIRAAIQKFYGGDIHAFQMLDRSGLLQFQKMMDVYERNVLSEESMAAALATTGVSRERSLTDEELDKGARAAAAGHVAVALPWGDFVETLNVLVSLLENGREELRGHSALVARLCRKMCERVRVTERETHGVLVAAYLHDLGKSNAYHLTSLNVAEYEGHRAQAHKTYITPVRLFESVHLPEATIASLTHLYERYDGEGFPDRLSAKEIPLGARLVAMVETYADLTTNSRNPYRKTLDAKDACEVLGRYRGTVFDPNLVDLFRIVVLGDDLREKLLSERTHALLVDSDAEDTTVLELRLIEHGFDVEIARTASEAIKTLETTDIDIVMTEVDLEPYDGFKLLQQIRQLPRSKEVPIVFVTRRADRDSVHRGFELGAADYLVKPASADVVVAKVAKLLEASVQKKGGRGVSGSLREMSLPDVLQVLSNGRKTGQLRIVADGKAGEIHFAEGEIHNAMFGPLRGEEALYAMLVLNEGDFALDPSFRPSTRMIHQSTEGLLLEGMRRMDEQRR